jgi:hypothetical protein
MIKSQKDNFNVKGEQSNGPRKRSTKSKCLLHPAKRTQRKRPMQGILQRETSLRAATKSTFLPQRPLQNVSRNCAAIIFDYMDCGAMIMIGGIVMRLFKTKVWCWLDVWLLKWCAFLFGIAAGAYFHDYVMPYTWVILVVAGLLAIRLSINYFGKND